MGSNSNIHFITADKIASIITKHLHNEKAIFIFPTDVATNGWAEWVVSHSDITDTKAVPLERFVAWDKFKSDMLKATQKDKKSVPAILRKIFVRNLISENAAAVKEGNHIFYNLISPKFAENAYAFTDWISKMLPSLKRWHEKFSAKGIAPDADDKDFLMLYERYSAYLDSHNLFEPSWIDPEFERSNIECVIFFPELLEDFDDYKEIFSAAQNIKLYCLPQENRIAATQQTQNELTTQSEAQSAQPFERSRPIVNFFSNARTEIRALALQIKSLMVEGADTNSIAVNVPDMETWRPYIEREFKLYGIPFVTRSGEKLTQNSAARIFVEMQNCIDTDFSYDSVRSLLLDEYVPWKTDTKTLRENLIRSGKDYACICSYFENEHSFKKVDIWKKALSAKNTGDTSELELTFYEELRNETEAICNAKTFGQIRAAWFVFRERFLDEEKFDEMANLVIGQCIQELSGLIEIERDYVAKDRQKIFSPFSFFLNEITQKTYQPQQKQGGVSIFPYKLTATAPFEYQFVVDASQSAISVSYKNMNFLSRKKRQLLDITDNDLAGDNFVRVYAGKNNCIFSGAADTFSGAAIPYSYLQKQSKGKITELLHLLEKYDFVSNEKKWYIDGSIATDESTNNAENTDADKSTGIALFPKTIMQYQKNGFEEWKKSYAKNSNDYAVTAPVKNRIDIVLRNYRQSYDKDATRIHITQKDLTNFFVCPRKWLLNTAMRFEEDSLDAELMGKFDAGNILHEILEHFMHRYKESAITLPCTSDSGFFEDENAIRIFVDECTTKVFYNTKNNTRNDFSKRPLTLMILNSQKDNFVEMIMSFLHDFCSEKKFGGYKVCAVEKKFSGKLSTDFFSSSGISANSTNDAWTFAGKLDCVLVSDTGDIAIIDYKSGKTPSPASNIADENGDIENFQMPVYVSLWTASNTNNLMPSAALFCSIKNIEQKYVIQEPPPSSRSSSVGGAEYKHTLLVAHKKAEEFFNKVTTLDLEATTPTVKTYNDCKSCNFNAFCRTTYSAAGNELRYEIDS